MWQQAIEFIQTQLGSNQLLAGGAILGALGILLNYLRRVPFLLMYWSRLLFVTELDIPDRTPAFDWITEWVANHKYMKKARRVCLQAKGSKDDQAQMSPAPGTHFMWWQGRPLILRRLRKEGTGDLAHKAFRETWKVTLVGRRAALESFVAVCQEAARAEQSQFILVREASDYYWDSGMKRRKRPVSSVILPTGVEGKLMTDLRDFIDSREWYEGMSIPWRRGYLLHGPPGNGKSSLITAVASEIGYTVCIVNLRSKGEDDLTCLMKSLPEKSILLLEDIDCIFEQREGKYDISLSTLLNLLDGVDAPEGRILFMTTNKPNVLDPALVRPGRVDMVIELPNATQKQIERLYKRFYPLSKNAESFAARAAQFTPSMARLQGFLLRYRNSCRTARQNIEELKND